MSVRALLRRWLVIRNVSQSSFAATVGVTPSAINQLLRPRSAVPEAPKLGTVLMIEAATGGAIDRHMWLTDAERARLRRLG